ncbi:hypothetical protein BJ875DRAFT_103654 [Amylocarpus encephaloides]|uniref:DUF4470 domain-containing protein n=1 Tax=Amylocarpus encephaloides TaxID=45428 RepID=A0A9P8C4B5_9HELO|nr:hypothetical protein BJ875DRAFT_103654 [Amylocarpus encephaloides]
MSSEEEAQNLREEGNALYKIGELPQAISKYLQASKITPNDPAPLGNISAALFETGQYKRCIPFAEKATRLHKGSPGYDEAGSQVQRLEQRIAKARVHLPNVKPEERIETRLHILQNLPRYRPSINPALEYYHVGHDVAFCLYDEAIDRIRESDYTEEQEGNRELNEHSGDSEHKEEPVSFFLAGVGDARNLYRTIISILEVEKSPRKHYHIAINDVNSCVLVRDLIVFMLVDELSQLDDDSGEYLEVLATIYFIYLGVMIPLFVFERLQSTLSKALLALQSGQQPVKIFHLYDRHFPEYIKVLTSWQTSALTLMASREVITLATRQVGGTAARSGDNGENRNCGAERELYLSSLVLRPPVELLTKYDRPLFELLQHYASRPRANAPRFRDYLCKHWRVNTTLIDENRYHTIKNKRDMDFGHDPFAATQRFSFEELGANYGDPELLFDFLRPFFDGAAKALRALKGRLQIEVLLGDCVDVAERLRFGLVRDLNDQSPECMSDSRFEHRPKHFPTRFERIHLSNVPDYMNGNLSLCLYFGPLLKKFPEGLMMSCCLRNSGSWQNIESFLSEYQLIHNEKMLTQLTSVVVFDRGLDELMPMRDYVIYGYGGPPASFNRLLPKRAFMKWFYALFFRLALPFNQDILSVHTIILSPVNLTILFRIMSQLEALHYPSHWMSEALNNILENKVITAGRPPRASTTKPAAVERNHPEKRLCTTPFSFEMTVLSRMFQPLLPFALTGVPAAKDIYLYKFDMSKARISFDPAAATAQLALFFWDQDYLRPLGFDGMDAHTSNLRVLLDPSWGEADPDFNTPCHAAFRENGMAVYTTFATDKNTVSVTAWMYIGFVEKMLEQDWGFNLYRTDNYQPIFDIPCMVRDSVERGVSWAVS